MSYLGIFCSSFVVPQQVSDADRLITNSRNPLAMAKSGPICHAAGNGAETHGILRNKAYSHFEAESTPILKYRDAKGPSDIT